MRFSELTFILWNDRDPDARAFKSGMPPSLSRSLAPRRRFFSLARVVPRGRRADTARPKEQPNSRCRPLSHPAQFGPGLLVHSGRGTRGISLAGRTVIHHSLRNPRDAPADIRTFGADGAPGTARCEPFHLRPSYSASHCTPLSGARSVFCRLFVLAGTSDELGGRAGRLASRSMMTIIAVIAAPRNSTESPKAFRYPALTALRWR